jgi:lipopolysaccharide biosynthesis glycosyltransferase
MTEIPIFFSIDDNYVPFLATAINSAIKNSNPDRNYRAIVIHKGISEENAQRLLSLATDHFKIELVQMSHSLEEITDRMSNRLRYDIFTLTIYFRLFIPAMFPQYDKGIYIDSDVVLTSDIAELYDVDLGGNYLGACRDASIADAPPLVDYTVNVVGMREGDYINSGVLLMDLKKLREKKFDEHFLNLLTTFHFDSVAPDQDYINAICNGKIHYLPEEWDAMPNDSRPALDEPKLIHYNLYSKPWRCSGVQYEDEFWRYAEDSGYIDEIKAIRKSCGVGAKKKDSEALKILVDRALEIGQKDVTLKKSQRFGS